jgi:hypothetical protein
MTSEMSPIGWSDATGHWEFNCANPHNVCADSRIGTERGSIDCPKQCASAQLIHVSFAGIERIALNGITLVVIIDRQP